MPSVKRGKILLCLAVRSLTEASQSKTQVTDFQTRPTTAQPMKYVTAEYSEEEQIIENILQLENTDDLPFKSSPWEVTAITSLLVIPQIRNFNKQSTQFAGQNWVTVFWLCQAKRYVLGNS